MEVTLITLEYSRVQAIPISQTTFLPKVASELFRIFCPCFWAFEGPRRLGIMQSVFAEVPV